MMPELQRPTVELHFEERGAGDPALVFLHGWCDGSASWTSTMEAFAGSHRCIAPDMRGHGRSKAPLDHAFTAEALSNDVVALCEAAQIEAPVLIGHSYGGYLAAEVARRFPGFARAVVIEDQALDIRGFAGDMRRLESVIRSPESHMAFRSGLFGSMITDAMPAADRAVLERLANETPVAIGLALWAGLFEFTADELAERAFDLMRALDRQPSLTIEAEPRPDYHATLAQCAPNVQIEVIPSGHWIHLEHPGEFHSAVQRFLESVSQPSEFAPA